MSTFVDPFYNLEETTVFVTARVLGLYGLNRLASAMPASEIPSVTGAAETQVLPSAATRERHRHYAEFLERRGGRHPGGRGGGLGGGPLGLQWLLRVGSQLAQFLGAWHLGRFVEYRLRSRGAE